MLASASFLSIGILDAGVAAAGAQAASATPPSVSVTVEIGTHDGFRIDPLRFAVVGLSDSNVEGDGGLSGTATMDRDTAEIAAALVLIDTQTKRSGAGSRMLRLWCKIMRGWRVNRWVVVGAGEEGLPFFEAMDRKGVARIIAMAVAFGGILLMVAKAERAGAIDWG